VKTGRVLTLAGVVALSIACMLPIAHAWEFNLAGNWAWTYEYYTQQGRNGFFGPYDVDADNVPQYTANFWYGIPRIISRNIASGSDAVAQYTYLDLFPEITVNRAVRLRGQYRVGGWNDALGSAFVEKTNSYYLTGTSVGTQVAMAEGHWTQFWASVHSPWGRVVYGKRPKVYGLGLQYDGVRTVASESLLIRSDYGPLTFGIGLYPYRQSLPARALSFQEYFYFSNLVNRMDKNLTPETDIEGFVLYRSGPLEMGVFSGYFSYHQGAEVLPIGVFVSPDARFSEDGNIFQGTTYIKFNNGRFFFNAEAAWMYGTKKQNANFRFEDSGLIQLTSAPTYVEQWRYMVETGVMAGPAKLSLLYGFTPGVDRRNGVLIDRQPSSMLRQQLLTRELASVTVWKPYAYVMAYMFNSGMPTMSDLSNINLLFNYYASGLSSPRLDSSNREGAMLDAQVLAARLDYAAAANLNLFATFVKANRASDGYGWGCIFPVPWYYYEGYSASGEVMVIPGINRLSPAIPDKDLGYEIDAGVDWKLLEGWTLEFLVGRWQPGKWFSYACVDRSVPGWSFYGFSDSSNNYGTRPNKTIDPVWATNITLSVDF
jgi:hypothetical protein